MWRLPSLVLLTLLLCASAFGQSTTVSGSIQDSPDGQLWFGGTYSFVFRVSPTSPTGAYFWQGAPFSTQQTIAGALDGSGHYSVSIPSNTAITPAGSTWDLTLCPLATSPCFTVQKITITGGTQTVAPAPPSVRINMGSPAPNTRAYRDGELVAGSLGQTYFNVTDGLVHVCNLVPCTVWNPIGGVINVAVAPTGACTPGSIPEQVISTGVIYTCQASVWAPIASSASAAGSPGQYQLNSGGVLGIGGLSESGGSVTNALDLTSRGPNPGGVDVRFFGAVALNPNSVPAPTGTITSGTNSLVVSAVSGVWAKGMGIAVAGAGTTHSMVTPAAPTVTPSCSTSETHMDYTTPAGAGSTAYQYQLALWNPSGGYTAASTTGTTSTGNASLGENTLTITSISTGTGQQKTALVSGSTANLAVGCVVHIAGTSDDGEYGGTQIVDGLPDGTHFTYTNGTDVAHGISTTTATGGTGFYWLCNHITVPAPNADGHQYMVFGRTSGSNVFLDFTKVINLGYTDATYLSWDDYGPTMMASPPTSWFVPTSPPVSAVQNTLLAFVGNIAGTTFTLVDKTGAAVNASNSVTSTPTRFDNMPAIIAAEAATGFVTNGGGGTIRFPAFENASGNFCFVTSTYFLVTVKAVIQDGPVCNAATIQLAPSGVWRGTLFDAPRLSLPQFASQPLIPIISQGANPVILLKGGGSLSNLTVTLSGNGGIGVFKVADAGSFYYENLNLASTGAGDYMSIPWYDYQDKTSGSFGGVMDKITCTTGPNQTTGVTLTPCMAFKYNNQYILSNIAQNRRGIFIVPFNGAGYDISMNADSQGMITPLVAVSQEISGNVPGHLKLHNLNPDTTAFPVLANLSPASGSIGFSVLIDGWNNPSSNGPVVSGKPFTSGLTMQRGVLQSVNEKNIGQNVGVNWEGGNSGNNPGYNITALRQMVVHYSGNHTTLANEAAVVSDATGTITIDCTINGAVWDVYSQAGTTTVAPSAGCTLYAKGATGSFILSNSQGIRIQVDNQGGAARAQGGGSTGGSSAGSVHALQGGDGGGGFEGTNTPTGPGIFSPVYDEPTSAGVAAAIRLPGVLINPQTGTTYIIGSANYWCDRGTVITASNAGAQTYTLVNPSTTCFGFNHFFIIKNIGPGTVTAVSSGFKINGADPASLLIAPSWTAFFWSNGVDYFASRLPDFGAFPNCVGGGNALQFTTATGIFSCGSSSAGVSSITGDGIIISNSGSTGAVTLTQASIAAHKFIMNNTAGSAAPGAQTPGKADLLGTLVYNDQINTYGAFNQNFSAATWEIPAAGGFAVSASSNFGLDTTAKTIKCYVNNADSTCMATTATDTTTTHAAFASATPGLYTTRAIVLGDLPTPSFPLTVAGTVTSGGIPCFTSTTQESSSALMTVNVYMKGGGAGVCPSPGLTTDDGTTSTYTGTGGTKSPAFTSTGTTAGFVDYPQGTTSAAVAPCNVANSICEQAPASVTAYVLNKPGAAPVNNNSAALCSNASPSVCAFTKMSQTAFLTSNYTNATTTFSNVTGISFSVEASTNYKVTCDLDYQTSATTADIKIQWTGPASPTAVTYDLATEVTASTLSASVATAFSTALSEAGTPTITTNFPLRTTLTLINGANAGTIQLQAAATGTGTITVVPGSCSAQ